MEVNQKQDTFFKVEFYIKPPATEKLQDFLKSIGVTQFTFNESRLYEKGEEKQEAFRGVEYTVEYFPSVIINTFMNKEQIQKTKQFIKKEFSQNSKGISNIFLYFPIEDIFKF